MLSPGIVISPSAVDSSNLVVAGEVVLGQAAVQRGHTVAAQQQQEGDSEGAAR